LAQANTTSRDRRLAAILAADVAGYSRLTGADEEGTLAALKKINIAARLEAMAEPGGICVSRFVRDQVRDRLDLAFEDMGKQALKNISNPIQIYRVALSEG